MLTMFSEPRQTTRVLKFSNLHLVVTFRTSFLSKLTVASWFGPSGPLHYPEGTVLLETLVRYGRISFKDGDVMIWHQQWKPSERTILDIARDWGTVPEAKVQFRSLGSGNVTYTFSKVQPRLWASLFERCKKQPQITFLILLSVAMLGTYCIWRLAPVYNRPRMPDQ